MRSINLLLITLIFSGCTSTPTPISDSAPDVIPVDIASIPDAVPVYEVRTRAGNPPSYDILGKHYTLLPNCKNYVKKGIASWYGTKFHGRKTSNGETYNMYAMTAAHKTLPIPCYARVTNLKNNRSIVVRINDRGPFHENRIIDLSYAAAIKLGISEQGTGLVEVQTIEPEPKLTQQSEAITPSSHNTSTAKQQMYLQVGAFSQQVNALAAQSRIQAHAITSHRILSLTEQGNNVHKVQIGPIATVQEIDDLTKTLAELGFNDSLLIVDQ